jgi:hypothetical protein
VIIAGHHLCVRIVDFSVQLGSPILKLSPHSVYIYGSTLKSEINIKTFRRVVTAIILLILCIHILMASALTFLQGDFTFGKSKVARVYKYFIHLGPFYREEAIQSSPHFVILKNGEAVDVIQKHADEYKERPWKINQLAMRDYADRTTQAFFNTHYYSARRMEKSAGFKKLSRLTKAEFPDIKQGDSIRWIYFNRWYIPEEKSWINDTLYMHSFQWKMRSNGK